MALLRRWFLILFALTVGGGQVFAASREERAYGAAVQSFNDKFYPLAETRLAQFLQTYRKSTNGPTVILLLAQSEFYQKNYPAVTNRLGDPANLARAKMAGIGDRYVYWQAEAQYALGDFANAAQTFVLLTDDFQDSPLALQATVEAAAAFAQLGQWPETDRLLENTNGLFQRMARLDPANDQVANGRLLQAESKCTQQGYMAAISILNLLNPATLMPEQDWKREYLLFRANLGLTDLDAALAATTNLLQMARAGHGGIWATNLAESVTSRASVLEQQGQLTEAAAALQENLSGAIPAAQQQQAVLKLADLAIAQNNLTNAEATLESFVAQYSDSPAADIAQLTLGEMYLKDYLAQPAATNRLITAQAKLEGVATNSPLAGKAFLARGWCAWLENDYLGSLANFQAAAQRLPMSEDLAVARFKMGDAQYAMNNYAGAQANYQAVLTDFSTLPQVTNSLGSRALYQILRTHLALHEVTGVEDAMRQLLGYFFTSAPAESTMLLAGEAFSDFDDPGKARDVFHGFKVEHGDSPLMPQVAFAIGRTFEREQKWESAVTNYEAWLQVYPTNELRPQVEYARDWAVSQTGDEERAFELFANFTGRYTNSLTPLALLWVADHYFRLGTNYDKAELNYQLIFQNFPTNELAGWAQLMAARAAMGLFDYKNAIRLYLDPLVNDTNSPPELVAKAKFAYCEALLRTPDTNFLSNLQLATNLLSQICAAYPTNEPGALAWYETGNFNQLMGALDPATNAYAQVLVSPAATEDLRDQAQVGLGMVLEKKTEGLPDDAQKVLRDLAMKYYQAVFEPDSDSKSEFWMKKAGLQILALNAKTGTLQGDALNEFIGKMERVFPQLKDSLESKRLALKN